MTSSNQDKTDLIELLKGFSKQYLDQYQQKHKHLPIIEHDDEWPSPCEIQKDNVQDENKFLSEGEVFWQPIDVEKEHQLNFNNVESALELTLNSDVKTYFTTLYSETLDATCEEGNLSLLFAWNNDDFQRLQENIIGHILMKQRLKQEITVFFAVTDEEDMIISVDNNTGAVWVERVGCQPHKKLAESLAEFLNKVSPLIN